MRKYIKIILFFLINSIFLLGASNNEGKGTLYIKTQIIPVGTTKKYLMGSSLILDAGVLNSNSSINELPIASVSVNMYTARTGGNGTPNGISGEFNNVYKLGEFNELLKEQKIDLGALTRYKNGKNAELELVAKNFRVVNLIVEHSRPQSNGYVFIAYPEDATINENGVTSFSYTFDLYLKVRNFNVGDIVRGDVTTGMGNGVDLDAVGHLQDIIKDQFRMLQ